MSEYLQKSIKVQAEVKKLTDKVRGGPALIMTVAEYMKKYNRDIDLIMEDIKDNLDEFIEKYNVNKDRMKKRYVERMKELRTSSEKTIGTTKMPESGTDNNQESSVNKNKDTLVHTNPVKQNVRIKMNKPVYLSSSLRDTFEQYLVGGRQVLSDKKVAVVFMSGYTGMEYNIRRQFCITDNQKWTLGRVLECYYKITMNICDSYPEKNLTFNELKVRFLSRKESYFQRIDP